MNWRWALRDLWRHRVRTTLSLVGIAIASALLLDMMMLSGGLERSFEKLLLGRGYQLRVTPKGTLPFDTEASMGDAAALVRVALGTLQMVGAAISLLLLVQAGVTVPAVVAVCLTTAVTLTSIVLFRVLKLPRHEKSRTASS